MEWYDAVYGNDPSTDNIFGEEMRAERRHPALLEFLRRGGHLGDFTPRPPQTEARAQLTAMLDRALAVYRKPE
jgi:hypothetical protein